MSESIRVAVRVRPLLPNESPNSCVRASGNQIVVGDDRCFAFDNVFDTSSTSDDVYVALGQPLADAFLSGFNVSTIAYGQTGAGKTHTMDALTSDVIEEIFCRLAEAEAGDGAATDEQNCTMRVSVLEIYNEHIGDLLSASARSPAEGGAHARDDRLGSSGVLSASNPSLQLREDPKEGVYVPGLTDAEVHSAAELRGCVGRATANRKTASTLMNARSSRSHCVVSLTMRRHGVVARCCFVDLAGSERLKKSLGTRGGAGAGAGDDATAIFKAPNGESIVLERMKEGISINSGLLALGNVIVALCEHKPHVPYRSSKLTRLLQPMLGGNSKTAMVACVSPLSSSLEETLNTLKYANRAKSIKTSPHLIVSAFASHDEAERVIAALRKQLEDVQQQLQTVLAQGQGKHEASSAANLPPNPPAHALPPLGPSVVSKQLAELQVLLSQEQQHSRRLADDLFAAEYTVMVEVEKRKALERQVSELKSRARREATPADRDGPEDNSFLATSEDGGSGTRQRLAINLAHLQQLEEERDTLQALKTRREADTKRLHEALEKNGGADGLCGDDLVDGADTITLAELSQEIEAKEKMIAQLERLNEDATKKIDEYEAELASVGSAKAKLEEELHRAEALLEASEVAGHVKDSERKRLHAEFAERVRRAEERSAEYRRRVKQAEHEIQQRRQRIERTRQLQSQVRSLQEEVARHRSSARAEHRRTLQLSAAHSQEVHQFHQKVRMAERHVGTLQARLQRKETEIARAKALLESRDARSSRRRRPSHSRARSHTASAASPSRSNTQMLIDHELHLLGQMERELQEMKAHRALLKQSWPQDAPKWGRAVKGFTYRLTSIVAELKELSSPNERRAALKAEKADIEHQLQQLRSFHHMFSETAQQLEEFDNRIDNLNEVRRYHLHRVRRLQTGRNFDGGNDGTPVDSADALPSVREIASTHLQSDKKWRRHSTHSTVASAARHVAQLEGTIARLRAESEELKKEVAMSKKNKAGETS